MISSLIVTVGVSGWIFWQVFKQDRREVYSNLEFEVPDFKVAVANKEG